MRAERMSMPGTETRDSGEIVIVASGEDRPGTVAAITRVIAAHGVNIVSLDQYSDDPDGGAFFQRCVVRLPDRELALAPLEADLRRETEPLGLSLRIRDLAVAPRMAILASTSDHCLLDLLWRHRRGELPVSVPMVISNHTNTADDVRSFGVPFFHVPSAGPDKSAAEAEILQLLDGNVDFVVLARYMQILSEAFIERLGVPVITSTTPSCRRSSAPVRTGRRRNAA